LPLMSRAFVTDRPGFSSVTPGARFPRPRRSTGHRRHYRCHQHGDAECPETEQELLLDRPPHRSSGRADGLSDGRKGEGAEISTSRGISRPKRGTAARQVVDPPGMTGLDGIHRSPQPGNTPRTYAGDQGRPCPSPSALRFRRHPGGKSRATSILRVPHAPLLVPVS
jgi:hypothetical protein